MENKNGEALLHSDTTPKTNNFGDKITEKSADMQVSPAFDMLMESVENPTEPSPLTSGMLKIKTANEWQEKLPFDLTRNHFGYPFGTKAKYVVYSLIPI